MKLYYWIWVLVFIRCTPDDSGPGRDLTGVRYEPVPYELKLPEYLEPPTWTEEHPLTKSGVILGRALFYDSRLSSNSTKSCATCHRPKEGFSGGKGGGRMTLSLINVGYDHDNYGWDGRWPTIESAIDNMIQESTYLQGEWSEIIPLFQEDTLYPILFRKAYGISNTTQIDKEHFINAIAQFLQILIARNSKYDRVVAGNTFFSPIEQDGADMFFDANPLLPDAECAHCHIPPSFAIRSFANNGMDSVNSYSDFIDAGRGAVTHLALDTGRFKIPTLRNIAERKQFMHDGRFIQLSDVISFYNSGGHRFENYSNYLHPLHLSEYQQKALLSFLYTLTDTTLRVNPDIKSPF